MNGGVKVETGSREGLGPALHGAIEGCNFELVSEMMGIGADPDARDVNGMTPIMKLFSLDRRIDTWRRIANSPEKYDMECKYRPSCRLPIPGSLTSLT